MSRLIRPLACGLGAAFLLFGSATAWAVLELVEESLEAIELEIRVNASFNGHAIGLQCDECNKQRFKVTPETVYIRNSQKVDPSMAYTFSGKPGTIVYDIKTQKVTKILQAE